MSKYAKQVDMVLGLLKFIPADKLVTVIPTVVSTVYGKKAGDVVKTALSTIQVERYLPAVRQLLNDPDVRADFMRLLDDVTNLSARVCDFVNTVSRSMTEASQTRAAPTPSKHVPAQVLERFMVNDVPGMCAVEFSNLCRVGGVIGELVVTVNPVTVTEESSLFELKFNGVVTRTFNAGERDVEQRILARVILSIEPSEYVGEHIILDTSSVLMTVITQALANRLLQNDHTGYATSQDVNCGQFKIDNKWIRGTCSWFK